METYIHSALRDQIRRICSARSNEIVGIVGTAQRVMQLITLIEYGLWRFKLLKRRPPKPEEPKISRRAVVPNHTKYFQKVYEANSGNPSAENGRMDGSNH